MTPGVCLAVPSWRFWLFGVCLLISVCITFHFFVTVYLVLKAPPSCRWFSVLLLCIPARCLCSFCLYPCSPSRLLLFIYHMCLPLPVVLTPLLLTLCRLVYAAHCPRGIYGFLCLFYSSLPVLLLSFCHGLYDSLCLSPALSSTCGH